MTDLSGRTVLLTGALGSLGRAQAKALHAAGAEMILLDRPGHVEAEPFTRTLGERVAYVGQDLSALHAAAAFALVRAVAPGMKARRSGRIVNFCSVTLSGEWDGYVPYVASKGAMLGLTKSLARELGPFGIGVNAVSPGAVVSEAEARVFGERAADYSDWVIARQCLKTRIQPDAIADLVLFLVSPAAAMITGQNIHCDGGW